MWNVSFTVKYVNVPTISFSKNPDVLFSSLWRAMWICSGSCTLSTFGFSSVLGKTWFLVRFVLAEFCFCPISNRDILVILAINAGLDRTKRCTENSSRLEILTLTHLTTTYMSLGEFFDHVLYSDYQKSLWARTWTARHSCKTRWRPASSVLRGTTRQRSGSRGQTAWV